MPWSLKRGGCAGLGLHDGAYSRALGLILNLALNILAAPRLADAQPRVIRTGFLNPAALSGTAHVLEAFRQGVRELGMWRGRIAVQDSVS